MKSPARPPLLLVCLASLALLAGCASSVTARKVVALDSYQHIFVEQPFNENHHLDELLAAELRRMGRDATSGPRTMMPDNTDAVLTYDARWTWDFKTYLIELNVELHTAHSNKKLADARYYQPSVRTKPPEEMIREMMVKMFAKS